MSQTDFSRQPGLIKPSLSMDFVPIATRKSSFFNCLAYALNEPRLGWVRPGFVNRTSSDPAWPYRDPEPWSPETLRKRLIEDGLEPVSDDRSDPSDTHLIAAWMGQVFDKKSNRLLDTFHFARRDASGLWSHKDGYRRPASRILGIVPILHPRMIVHPDYDRFSGYFRVPASGIACTF